MQGLAWDDHPEEDILRLATSLQRRGVQLHVASKEDEFADLFLSRTWDFVVKDWLKGPNDLKNMDTLSTPVGKKIIFSINKSAADKSRHIPIFIITNFPQEAADEIEALPTNVVIKSKKAGPAWLAEEMVNELKARGVYVDRTRAFLVYGGNETLRKELIELSSMAGLVIEYVRPGTLVGEIAAGLVQKMNNCGVIIALCTADDQWKGDNTTHPRQNVMLEIGLAIGLWRGPERCIVLQQWGSSVDQQAVLPSDLGGLLTLRFETCVKECWNELHERLKMLGAHTNEQADRKSGA